MRAKYSKMHKLLSCVCFAILLVGSTACIMPMDDDKVKETDTSFDTLHGWDIFQTEAHHFTTNDSNNASFEYILRTRKINHVENFRSFSYYSDFNIEHSGQTTKHTSRMIIMDDGEDTVVWFDVDGTPYINEMWYMYVYKDWLDGKMPEKPDIDSDWSDLVQKAYSVDEFF